MYLTVAKVHFKLNVNIATGMM